MRLFRKHVRRLKCSRRRSKTGFCAGVFLILVEEGAQMLASRRWRSLRSALASIWRIRSRVTSNCLPTSSRCGRCSCRCRSACAEPWPRGRVSPASTSRWLREALHGSHLDRRLHGGVLDEVAQVRILVVADRRLPWKSAPWRSSGPCGSVLGISMRWPALPESARGPSPAASGGRCG